MAVRPSLVWIATVCALSWSCGSSSGGDDAVSGSAGANTSGRGGGGANQGGSATSSGGSANQGGSTASSSGSANQGGSTTSSGGSANQTGGTDPMGGADQTNGNAGQSGANPGEAGQPSGGRAGASDGTGNEGGKGGQAPEPAVFNPWALWHMPNPAAAELPNPSSYDTTTAGVVLDKVTGLSWQKDVPASTYTWADAKTYCANLVLAGFDDWRLPSRIELVSLIDFTIANPGPTIDAAAFPDASNATFWTASARALYTDEAWYVQFSNGFAFYDAMTVAYAARCVR